MKKFDIFTEMKKAIMKRYILSEKREISKLCCNSFERHKKKRIHIEPELIDLFGTIHLRRRHVLGGEGSKICQLCRWIVLKNCRR